MVFAKLRSMYQKLLGIEPKPDPGNANLTKDQVIEIAKIVVKSKGMFWDGNPATSLYRSGEDIRQIEKIVKTSTGEQGWLVDPNIVFSEVNNNPEYLWWEVSFNLDLIDAIPIVVDIDDKTGQAFYIREGRF